MKLFSKRPSASKRGAQVELLSKAVQLEETMDPRLTRLSMLSGALIVFMFITWCAMADLNELARTSGTIEPVGQERVVQHPDGGVVATLHVQEGQRLARGDLIVTLAGQNLQQDLSRAERRLRQLLIDEVRLRAYLKKTTPDFSTFGGQGDPAVQDASATYRAQLAAYETRLDVATLQRAQRQRELASLCDEFDSLTSRMALARDFYQKRQRLFDQGLVTSSALLQAKEGIDRIDAEASMIAHRIEAGSKSIKEYTRRVDAVQTEDREVNFTNLNAVLSQVGETTEFVQKLREQVDRLEVRTPVDGIVKGLGLVEPGEVVQSATTITKIVPIDERLVARVRISPRDIGHLDVGLPVQVKVSAYDFARYGAIKGELVRISPATFQDDRGQHYYSGEIQLAQNHVGDDPLRRPISPGMLISADIVTGSKSILRYLLQPVYASFSVALSER